MASPITKLQGSIVALITPMKENGDVDTEGLKKLVEWHITEGTAAIVACGTTGESVTLSEEEWEMVVRICLETAAGRLPVIAGTGSNSTAVTIKKTKKAQEMGCKAALIVTPYYNKPTQRCLIAHYSEILKQVPQIPIILYNVPGRTACDLLVETAAELADMSDRIFAIKEASGKFEKYKQLKDKCKKGFLVYSGEDDQSCDAMLDSGIDGVISVTANVCPRMMTKMCMYALCGDREKAKLLNNSLMPLHSNLFCESNPIPAKWALYSMKKISTPHLRLPLLSLSPAKRSIVEDAYAGIQKDEKANIHLLQDATPIQTRT